MGSHIPSIRIRDATIDDNLEAIARVYFDGFSTTVIHQLVYPGGPSTSARENFIRRLRKELSVDLSSASRVRIYVKVAELMPSNDEDAPEIIAMAKWKFMKEPLSSEAWNVKKKDQMTQEELGEGANLKVWLDFMRGIHEIRKERMSGIRCLHLSTLASHPAHRGLGAATALLQWGVDLADKERIPAFLEASPHAYSLYLKYGFKDLHVQDLALEGTVLVDEKDWG